MRASSTNLFNIKSLGLTILSVILSMTLVVSWLATAANASGVMSVTSNISTLDVDNGDSLVVTVNVQDDGDVAELEIDHTFNKDHETTIPEFSVYADEADPYGGDGALFLAAGVNVTYSAASSQWVIDFGSQMTETIRDTLIADGHGDIFTMHLTLRDSSKNILWGSMQGGEGPRFTFNFADGTADVVEGTVYSLVTENEAADESEAVVPGVPNTSLGQ